MGASMRLVVVYTGVNGEIGTKFLWLEEDFGEFDG